MATKPATFCVLFDPVSQAWPFGQQGFVGDLDVSLRDSDEAAIRQRREHALDVLIALQVELGERRAAAHRRVALAFADQAQHDGAHELPALVGDTGIRAFGQSRDGTVHAPGLTVGGKRERVAVPLLPELEEGGGEQRQRPGLTLHVIDQRVGQLGLDWQPDSACGKLDGTP